MKNLIYITTNHIYLTKFYLFNKDVGSLNFSLNKPQIIKNKNYIFSVFPVMGNEMFNNITNNILLSAGIVLSSLFFLKVKSLFKPPVAIEPELVASYVPKLNNSLNFICDNYQTINFKLYKSHFGGSLRPFTVLNYNSSISTTHPTLRGGTTSLFFENVSVFTDFYTFKANAFINLLDVFTIYGKIPFFVMFFLSVYRKCIAYNFVSLCGKYILNTLLSFRKVS